ncbi:unnamed protein product [Caenorhabditis auriculariae]|uniref:Palmitoyl-protein thioesterase 1 n=1 Tax=Caenorhabditis auriculariae TaxID=2777116 RepID=A0A8S1HN78_9PELO|nr:unnamed protein product [Caenorhabditis auriculariae]
MKIVLLFLICLVSLSHSSRKHRRSHRYNENWDHHVKHHHRRTGAMPVPVVLWHGMGDCCCNPMSMGSMIRLLEEQIPGIHVHSLKLGENIASDTERGFFANMNEMVALACKHIKEDPNLAQGYNAMGFSQGGQFLRAVAQRCPDPPMKNLISVGGQQQGVFGMPYCPGDTFVCNSIRKLLDLGAYTSYVQDKVVQAQYWHDPYAEEEYKKKSIFLADINNEREINATYKQNLLKLKNFVLVLFKRDSMVVPKESAWFGFYKPGDEDTILQMNETRLYSEDRIGIKKLNESGRLHFLAVDGDHLQVPRAVYIDIFNKFFK